MQWCIFQRLLGIRIWKSFKKTTRIKEFRAFSGRAHGSLHPLCYVMCANCAEDSISLLSFSALHRYHICYNYAFSMLEIVIVGPKHTNHAYTGKICPMDTRIQISRQKDLYYDAMHYGKIFCDKISVIDSLTSNFAAIGWVFDMYMPPAML